MNCPKCSHSKTTVKNSRVRPAHITRRRKCSGCGFRFSTVEVERETIRGITKFMRATMALISVLNQYDMRMAVETMAESLDLKTRLDAESWSDLEAAVRSAQGNNHDH